MIDEERLSKAKELRRRATDPEEESYWAGYVRGTERKMGGKDYGTSDDHEKYLGFLDHDDPAVNAIGRGYRDGLKGVALK